MSSILQTRDVLAGIQDANRPGRPEWDEFWEGLMDYLKQIPEEAWMEVAKDVVPIADVVRAIRGRMISDGQTPDRAQDLAVAAAIYCFTRNVVQQLAK